MKSTFTFVVFIYFSPFLYSQMIYENFEDDQIVPEIELIPNIEGTNGQVQRVSGGYNSNWGLGIGKFSDGSLTKNGVDISLNANQINPNTYLFFNIKDIADENTSGDGILFSVNGQPFIQVYTFLPESWCNNTWGAFPPFNIFALAESSSIDLTNANNLIIRIQQEDDSDFISGGDADGFIIDNINVYSAPPEYAPLPFDDNFNNTANGQLGPSWRWSHADETAQVAGTTKPTGFVGIDASGNEKWVVMGKRCDDGFTANALDLHLNLLGESDVFLSFSIVDNAEENNDQDGIFFSNDGGQIFHQVYTFKPEDWCDVWGAFPPFSVDKLAQSINLDFTDKFVIRFQQYDDSDFISGGDRDGLSIDNVSVYSAPPEYAPLPFEDNFNNTANGQFGPSWRWSHADETAQVANTTKPTGFVGIDASGNEKWVAMGKRCDDGATANALDLHLNLLGESDVFLSFSIVDNAEENHTQDGIFFSNDGGENFEQVYTFKPEDWCDVWGAFPPFSVDKLAAAVGLDFTDKFVIRFQQYDDSDFISGGDRDGLSIDNVSVYSAPPEYAPLPFEDNFNNTVNGQFGPSWRWSHADETAQVANTTKPTGFVGIDASGNEKWVGIGKRCDDGITANALDLQLNLENCTNVLFSFDLRDNADEGHPEKDGLFFSNDGGESFHQIYPFDFDAIDNDNWKRDTIFLDDLVNALNLAYSNECIIRFQQYDDADFISGGDRDGYLLDNINVQCDFVNSTVGQFPLDEIKFYPNPTSDMITVEINGKSIDGEISIINLQGQIVGRKEFKGNSTVINTSNLESGIYFMRIADEKNEIKAYKLIKK